MTLFHAVARVLGIIVADFAIMFIDDQTLRAILRVALVIVMIYVVRLNWSSNAKRVTNLFVKANPTLDLILREIEKPEAQQDSQRSGPAPRDRHGRRSEAAE
jgi:hypothetical protein